MLTPDRKDLLVVFRASFFGPNLASRRMSKAFVTVLAVDAGP